MGGRGGGGGGEFAPPGAGPRAPRRPVTGYSQPGIGVGEGRLGGRRGLGVGGRDGKGGKEGERTPRAMPPGAAPPPPRFGASPAAPGFGLVTPRARRGGSPGLGGVEGGGGGGHLPWLLPGL